MEAVNAYSLPTPEQDAEVERIDHAALEAYSLLRLLPDGESRCVYVRRTAKGEYVTSGIKQRPGRMPAVFAEVGTFTNAINKNDLRDDIAAAVREL